MSYILPLTSEQDEQFYNDLIASSFIESDNTVGLGVFTYEEILITAHKNIIWISLALLNIILILVYVYLNIFRFRFRNFLSRKSMSLNLKAVKNLAVILVLSATTILVFGLPIKLVAVIIIILLLTSLALIRFIKKAADM